MFHLEAGFENFWVNLFVISVINTCGFLTAFCVTLKLLKRKELLSQTIYRVPAGLCAKFSAELRSALWSLALRCLFFAGAVSAGWIIFHPFQVTLSLLVACALFLFTEVWFYGIHRLLHTRALFFLHRTHHHAPVPLPITGAAFGTVETILILTGNLVPMVIFAHLLPWLSWPVFVGFLLFKDLSNFLDHMNVDSYDPRYMDDWRSQIFNSPTYHALHHARYHGNYAQSSPWLDRLFKTQFSDNLWAFQQVKSGQGLQKITARGQARIPGERGEKTFLKKNHKGG